MPAFDATMTAAGKDLNYRPFLRIPPFPGTRTRAFTASAAASPEQGLVDLLRRLKVGGSYWAKQPELPGRYILVRGAPSLASLAAGIDPVVHWTEDAFSAVESACVAIIGECDPWHMVKGASMVVTSRTDELCLVASILGIPVQLFDSEGATLSPFVGEPGALLSAALSETYENPFIGARMTASETIELCGFWRRLIDSNRDIAGGLGFASWKRDHVRPLLWGGGGALPFLRSARDVELGAPVAVWRAKIPPNELALLQEQEIPLIEVEDGFLRSNGLGADCVPPLSITVDRLGAYYDPAQPSELELLLQDGEFDDKLLARARRLRRMIVEASLSKYGRGSGEALGRPAGKRRHILVPGQVEDDRAVQSGGCGLVSNLDLLARVREQAPEAYIIYKPHPDVLAGHRLGDIPNRACLEHADQIVSNQPISSLMQMVDEVHVNTSLAGFEALLREKPVTTYGVPFYAGWGLTRDLGHVPARRNRRRTIDELVGAVLLIYPRYLDPSTGLPCPAEVAVERLSNDANGGDGLVVFMRRLQGKLMRQFRSFVR